MENEINDVEVTTENTGIELTDTENKEVKTFTEEEVNQRVDDLLSPKIAREKRRLERQYEKKYADYIAIGDIVSQGLEATDIKDARVKVKNFYEEQGMTFKEKHSDKDEIILGRAEAEELIDLGFDEAQEEANRLADIGYDKLSTRDKTKFDILAKNLTYEKNKKSLQEIGVNEDLLDNSEFKEFASQFNSKTPLAKVYEYYKQTQPQKEVNLIGSMKGNATKKVSDTFTEAELDKLSLDDLKDPVIWEKARKSMIK